jgi:hypothetical protein
MRDSSPSKSTASTTVSAACLAKGAISCNSVHFQVKTISTKVGLISMSKKTHVPESQAW